jgi:hypothetical protein
MIKALPVDEDDYGLEKFAMTHENGRVLADALVGSREPSEAASYQSVTWHDKTGTCQRPELLAIASNICAEEPGSGDQT